MDTEANAPACERIVAIGASAGGLEALERFFSALGSSPNAAFVVVQHLSPDHRTLMDGLLRRHTTMSVTVAEHGTVMAPGHVYVIPPGMLMQAQGGRLQLSPKPAGTLSLPIDLFFESVARDAGASAVAVVLSGTGSDGTQGALALSAAGAWVLAQEPSSARFDGMPRSVIASGVVDRVLDPEGLAQEVAALLEPGHEPRRAPTLLRQVADDPMALQQVLAMLTRATRIDFTHYKPATLLRRLERRMHATGLTSLERYRALLLEDPAEADTLRAELLIPVTAFFRDRESFAALGEKVLQPLLLARSAPGAAPLRIWVAATATGEEAFSVAMLIDHLAQTLGVVPHYKVFATDVEPRFLARAGAGRYPLTVLDSVPPEHRERFVVHDELAQVDPSVRQRIVFARHDLLADPPFTQLDLVCCRNMLIYLRPSAQERVLRRLEQALRVGGTLFLGGSESLPPGLSALEPVDARHKLFRLQHRPPPLAAQDLLGDSSLAPRRRNVALAPQTRAIDLAVDALLAQYTPAALVVTAHRELLHVFGDSQRYLRIPAGGATLDLLQLVDPALAPVLSTALHVALRDRSVQVTRPLEVPVDGRPCLVRARVVPLREEGVGPHLVVAFEELADDPAATAAPAAGSAAGEPPERQRHITDLESELAETRANLHATIQDLGTANEELQALNEELMAANEELQGTNEELQSVNEELHTVNAELQGKIEQLNTANADLEGLTRAGRVATVFVDAQLTVLRFTPEAAPLFRLREGDVGRCLRDLAHTLEYPDLYDDLAAALAGRQGRTREVVAQDGRDFLATVLPYGEGASGPAKAVVTFVDVSPLRRAEELQEVIDAQPAHIAVLDRSGIIRRVNRAWRSFAQAHGGDDAAVGVGADYLAQCDAAGQHDAESARIAAELREVLNGHRAGLVRLYPCESRSHTLWFLLHASRLEGRVPGAVVSHLDVTGWLRREPAPHDAAA